jgi:uncharacterized protein YjiS (DUF1127 family)
MTLMAVGQPAAILLPGPRPMDEANVNVVSQAMHRTHAGFETFPAAPLRRSGLSINHRNERRIPMGIRTTIKKWAAYSQTVRELNALDNRQLSDLGISRTDIQRVARDHARTL